MLDVGVPVWAHVVLLLGAFLAIVAIERAAAKRETELRRKLGMCRTSLQAAEIQRDQHRKTVFAQSIELARYRGQIPPELRVTQVLLNDKGEPNP